MERIYNVAEINHETQGWMTSEIYSTQQDARMAIVKRALEDYYSMEEIEAFEYRTNDNNTHEVYITPGNTHVVSMEYHVFPRLLNQPLKGDK